LPLAEGRERAAIPPLATKTKNHREIAFRSGSCEDDQVLQVITKTTDKKSSLCLESTSFKPEWFKKTSQVLYAGCSP